MSWTEARTQCQTIAPYNGDLASVPDQATNDFLTTLTTEVAWLGGNDLESEGVWIWTDGTPWSFESWNSGEPSNGGGNESFLELNYANVGGWNDAPLDAMDLTYPTGGYICQYKIDISNEKDSWRLVKVASDTATTTYDMHQAITSGDDVPGQTEVLYRPDIKGWQEDSVYSWTVRHQPSLSSLAISVARDGELLWGNEWVHTFTQPRSTGRVGVFADSQPTRFYNLTVQPFCL